MLGRNNRVAHTCNPHNVIRIAKTPKLVPLSEHPQAFPLRATASWLLHSLTTTVCRLWFVNLERWSLRAPWKNSPLNFKKRKSYDSVFSGTNLLFFTQIKNGSRESQKGVGEKTKRGKDRTYTSTLETFSASLCLISLAIEKKTSSTFIFVFALCRTIFFCCKQNTWQAFHRYITLWHLVATYSFKELDTILIGKSLTLGGRHSLWKETQFSSVVTNIEQTSMKTNAEIDRENQERIRYEPNQASATKIFKVTGCHLSMQNSAFSHYS